jgi:alcohol dehydrogenase (cytochrome c)
VALPEHAPRRLGLRRRQRADLFNYKDGGKEIKAAATADRNGFFYVLDRTNGKFIRGFPFVDKITWATGLDKDGRPIYNEASRPGAPGSEAKGSSVFVAPAFLGAKNWMPMAYNRTPGCSTCRPTSGAWTSGTKASPTRKARRSSAGFTIKPLNEDYIGVLRAIDPITGKEVWRHKNYAPLWGGVLTTKGNLVFTGTPEGFLQAFNAKTGEKVWEFQTGSGVLGSPVTWEMDGEQYVSVSPAGAARCRCGAAKWPSASRTSTRAACSGPSSCPKNWSPNTKTTTK